LQITGLTLGVTYKIEVSSTNDVGESSLSDITSVVFANVPSSPQTLTMTTTSQPALTAAWTAPLSSNGDAVRGYTLYIDDGNGGDFTLVYNGSTYASVYSYTIDSSTIECGLLYNLQITAINSAGESDPTLG
jgi:hypothetical protein